MFFDELKCKCREKTITIQDVISVVTELETIYAALLQQEYPDYNQHNLAKLLSISAIIDFFTLEKCLATCTLPGEVKQFIAEKRNIFNAKFFQDFYDEHSVDKPLVVNIEQRGRRFKLCVAQIDVTLLPFYISGLQAKLFKAFKTVVLSQNTRQEFYTLYQEQQYAEIIKKFINLAELCITRAKEVKAILGRVSDDIRNCSRRECEYYMKASLFYNAALTLYRRRIMNLDKKAFRIRSYYIKFEELDSMEKHIITGIYAAYLDVGIKIYANVSSFWNSTLKSKKSLAVIRFATEKFIDKINFDVPRLTQGDIAFTERFYTKTITPFIEAHILTPWFENCEVVLGPPPCSYTVLALGSLAIQCTTPYSDFELAILVANERKDIKDYFYHWAVLLNLQIQNIGETAIPKGLVDFSFNEDIRPGIRLDSGGKNPLGCPDGGCVLIQTPELMAEYIKDDAFRLDRFLPIEIGAFRSIWERVADHKYKGQLIGRFERAINSFLDAYDKALRKQRARSLFKADIGDDRFDPGVFMQSQNEGNLFEVKQDVYRLIHLLLEDAALYFGIPQYHSGWEKIELLSRKVGLSPDAICNLKHLYTFATLQRLRVYANYDAQIGTFSAFFKIQPRRTESLKERKQKEQLEFEFSPEQLPMLKEVYMTLIPLHNWVKSFVTYGRHDIEFQSFRDDSSLTRGKIAYRLADYNEVTQIFSGRQESLEALSYRGLALLRTYDNKEELFRTLNELYMQSYASGNFYNQGFSKYMLGVAYENVLEEYVPARKLYEQAQHYMNESRRRREENFSVEFSFMVDFRCADIFKYMDYSEAPRIRQRLLAELLNKMQLYPTFGTKQSLLIDIFDSLGHAFVTLGDARQGHYYFMQAKNTAKNIWSKHHPKYASILLSLAQSYIYIINDIGISHELAKQAVDAYKEFYGEGHVAMVVPLSILGQTHGYRMEFAEEMQYLILAKQIWESSHKEKDWSNAIVYADVLSDLGRSYAPHGFVATEDIEQALSYHQQALIIRLNCYKTIIREKISITCMNLSCTQRYLNNLKAAKFWLEETMHIQKSIYILPSYERAENYMAAGLLCLREGVLNEAIKWFLIAKNDLELCNNLGFTYVEILYHLGTTYRLFYNFTQAKYFLMQAHEFLPKVQHSIRQVKLERSVLAGLQGVEMSPSDLCDTEINIKYRQLDEIGVWRLLRNALDFIKDKQYIQALPLFEQLMELLHVRSLKFLIKTSYAEILSILHQVLSCNNDLLLPFNIHSADVLKNNIQAETRKCGEKTMPLKFLGNCFIVLCQLQLGNLAEIKQSLTKLPGQIQKIGSPLMYCFLQHVYQRLGDTEQANVYYGCAQFALLDVTAIIKKSILSQTTTIDVGVDFLKLIIKLEQINKNIEKLIQKIESGVESKLVSIKEIFVNLLEGTNSVAIEMRILMGQIETPEHQLWDAIVMRYNYVKVLFKTNKELLSKAKGLLNLSIGFFPTFTFVPTRAYLTQLNNICYKLKVDTSDISMPKITFRTTIIDGIEETSYGSPAWVTIPNEWLSELMPMLKEILGERLKLTSTNSLNIVHVIMQIVDLYGGISNAIDWAQDCRVLIEQVNQDVNQDDVSKKICSKLKFGY